MYNKRTGTKVEVKKDGGTYALWTCGYGLEERVKGAYAQCKKEEPGGQMNRGSGGKRTTCR